MILNDAELRQLTGEAERAHGRARGPRAGGRRSSSPSRASTARRSITRDGFFALPAYPMETVVDPTGAGDTFAGGFVGYVAQHVDAG